MSAVVNLRSYPNGILGPGQRAPAFQLKATPDQSIALSQLRGSVIQWSYCSPVGVNPGADGILQALEAMRASRTAEVV